MVDQVAPFERTARVVGRYDDDTTPDERPSTNGDSGRGIAEAIGVTLGSRFARTKSNRAKMELLVSESFIGF